MIIEDRTVSATAGRLAVRIWNPPRVVDAAPVLMFHDSLGCIEMWRDFPAALAVAVNRKVVAYDRLGFGRSDTYPGLLDPTFVAEEAKSTVALLQQACGFEGFVACGHSVGGGMAVETAARHKNHCNGLITLGAQAFVEDLTLQGIRDARGDLETEEGLARLSRYHGDKAEWVLRAWIDTWLSPAFKDWSLADALSDAECPALAIHGAEDQYGSRKHPEMIAGSHGHAAVLEGCGHFPHREASDAVVRLIAAYLER